MTTGAGQLLEAVRAVGAGRHGALSHLQRGTGDRDADARQRTAGVVLHEAVNRARRGALRVCRRSDDAGDQEEERDDLWTHYGFSLDELVELDARVSLTGWTNAPLVATSHA